MAKKNKSDKKTNKNRVKRRKVQRETDSYYFLKLTVFLILGSQWFYIQSGDSVQFPVPVGLILGLVIATHEHFQIDRKIEYAVLLISTFVAFWLPIGLVIQI